MRRQFEIGTVVVVGAALLGTSPAPAQIFGRPGDRVPVGRPVFPRPGGATLGPGVTRPSGAVLGPGVTRPASAAPGPGVPRATGPTEGPGVTRSTGATFGPGVTRPSGVVLGPGVERPTGATLGSGVTRPSGSVYGPGVTRGTGATPGPGVPRAVGPTPGPNVGRPTGATPNEGVERPTGPNFGFTFRPLFQEPFRRGDRLPRFDAERAGRERDDLSTEDLTPLPAERFDLLVDVMPLFDFFRFDLLEPFRFDLLIDTPFGDRFDMLFGPSMFGPFRPDLSTEPPPEVVDERLDLLTDRRPEVPAPAAAPPAGPIVGGTFTGGITGTSASWLLDADYWLGAWRMFDDPQHQAARFAADRPLSRHGPLQERNWIVSGYANTAPTWSALRDEGGWTLRGRAGYGPEWSALRQR